MKLSGLVGGYDDKALRLLVWLNHYFPVLPPESRLHHPAPWQHVPSEGFSRLKHTAKINFRVTRYTNHMAIPRFRHMALPGLGLHALKGNRRGAWAVSVSGNWRVTFRFLASDVTDVDYEDYH